MARYLVSYDLGRPRPTHAEMDARIQSAEWDAVRILESVWFISTAHTKEQVYDYLNQILTSNDRIIVAEVISAHRRNLQNQNRYKDLWNG